jgi:hypothetical protein
MLNKIKRFSERCSKAQQFIEYLKGTPNQFEDFEVLREKFGISQYDKADRSIEVTDTTDLQIDIKDEFLNQHNNGENKILAAQDIYDSKVHSKVLDCDDHSFNELEDFAEISTIAMAEDQTVIFNEPEKSGEMETRCEGSEEKHENEDMTFQ